VTIPSSVISIGDGAFSSCSSLTPMTFLGLVAPTNVGANWILSIGAGIRGHAYATSNFPAPGSVFNGLTMGTYIPVVPGVPPGVPNDFSATSGNAQVVLAWTAPADNGSSSIIGYKVYRRSNANEPYALIASPSGLNYTNTGLTNGHNYWYKVSAVNAQG